MVLFSLLYLNADKHLPNVVNTCERASLTRLSQATEPVVKLPADCNVMAWERMTTPQYSVLNGELLQYWGITNDKKQYYQEGW